MDERARQDGKAFNFARRVDAMGTSPYQRRVGNENEGHVLRPFGIGCRFLEEQERLEKFEPHHKEGVVIGYASLGGYQVLDQALPRYQGQREN